VRINREKITKELCETEDLIFFPETQEESMFIQRKLMDMGYKWVSGHSAPVAETRILSSGLVLLRGKIYRRGDEDNSNYLKCDLYQFDRNLSPDQALIMEQFNKFSARLEEIVQAVAEMQKELRPAKLDKTPLKGPGQDS
jgi:hypothetical protein